jgi:hypothetical protein
LAAGRECFASAGHDQDRAAAPSGHVGGDRDGDRVGSGECPGHGLHELVEREIEERRALDIVVGGCVEGDVDAARLRDPAGVPLHCELVENVELGGMHDAARASDVVGDVFETGFGAAAEVYLGSFPRVRARDR